MDGQPRDQAAGLTDSASAGRTLGGEETEDAGVRSLPERPAPRGPGDTLGRYHIDAVLGGGGMGVVYRAYDPDLEREVAVKVLRPDGSANNAKDEARRARLVREAQAMAKLSHPNVVAVYEVGTVDEEVFVAMELVEGADLRGWLQHAPRPWSAIVDVFVQAGRGLAAAHRAGLVHRDFKPHNMLVGDDGRVRVVDFGLARSGHSRSSDDDDAPESRPEASGATDAITRFGDIVGTPAYMAPEQHEGHEPDPRSDQFSFCVSLWEAVYGERPYKGRTAAQLYRAAVDGPPTPPSGRAIPPRLRRTMLRGLRPDPQERFESIDVLTAELRTLRGRLRWWTAAAIGVTVSAVMSVGLFATARQAGLLGVDGERPCKDSAAPLEAVWPEARRDDLREAFAAADPRQGPANAARLVEGLDRWAEAWTQARTRACRDTRIEGYESEGTLDRRMRCLDRRLGQVDALLGLWTSAAGSTEQALVALYDLSAPQRCNEAETAALPAAPEQPARAERLDALSLLADRARALRLAGRLDEAVALSGPLLEDARALGWPRFTAEVLALHAHTLADTGRVAAATELYAEAARVAASAHDTTLAADSLGHLAFHHAVLGGDPASALATSDAAEAMAQLAGPLERARVVNARGAALAARGEHESAIASFERAAELRIEGAGPDDPRVASILINLGGQQRAAGREHAARKTIARAAAIYAAAYPPEHPKNALPLQALGLLELTFGNHALAIEHEMKALAILRATYGDRHVRVGHSLNNIASAYLASGQPTQALPFSRDATAILEALLGPDHFDLGKALSLYAEALLGSNRPTEALPHARRAVKLTGAADGQHRALADATYVLTMALVHTGGDTDEIRRLTERAEAEYAAAGGSRYAAQLRGIVDAHLRGDPIPELGADP